MPLKPLYGALITVGLLSGCQTTPDASCAPASHCTEASAAPTWPPAGEIYPKSSLDSPPVVETAADPMPEPSHPTSGYPAHLEPHEVLPESELAPMAPGVLPQSFKKPPMEPDSAPGTPETAAGLPLPN